MPERRGPVRLPGSTVDDFLSTVQWASLCFEADDGSLCALPARLDAFDDDVLVVTPASSTELADAPGRGTAACLVADEFETYEGIRGVIAQGTLEAPRDEGHDGQSVVLRVSRRVGFGFAGTLPPALAGPAAAMPSTTTSTPGQEVL